MNCKFQKNYIQILQSKLNLTSPRKSILFLFTEEKHKFLLQKLDCWQCSMFIPSSVQFPGAEEWFSTPTKEATAFWWQLCHQLFSDHEEAISTLSNGHAQLHPREMLVLNSCLSTKHLLEICQASLLCQSHCLWFSSNRGICFYTLRQLIMFHLYSKTVS